ncbi:MAG: hypothetical protein DGJ47_000030 [Rickettsiaceae bacterium]
MIGKLKGKIDSLYEGYLIIDVGGVGYSVFASGKTLANLEASQACEILIETHVREDHIHLYGFTDLEEKSSFNILQSVKGVGTRMALGILSQMSPSEIQHALNTEDKTMFNNVSGVGKKLAERIITELKDKLISSQVPQNIGYQGMKINATSQDNMMAKDAVVALTNLGISKTEAHNRVATIITNDPDISINDLIRLALRN